MNERVLEFRVGVLVLATIIIAAILVLLFRDQTGLLHDSYMVDIRLPHARGVSEGTPIRKRGIIIGRVQDVRLDDAGAGVIVTAAINADAKIYAEEEVCELRETVLGDAELEIVPVKSSR